jgi:GNAT superfamily N-acetyltransferase
MNAKRRTMKSLLRELRRLPEFVRWRNPLFVFLMVIREIFRPLIYWYVYDIFETDLCLPVPGSYSKEKLDVRIYNGQKDLKRAVEDLTSMDGLLAADIELRMARGDVVAVVYAETQAVGFMWLTFSSGMELVFGTSWIIGHNEALRYESFVHPRWRGRAIHSLLNSAINRYALEHGILRTLGGVSLLNSQSRSLAKHFRKLRSIRLVIFRVRGVKWTYRKAIGAPLESRFAITPGFPTRIAEPRFISARRWKLISTMARFVFPPDIP